VHSHYQRRVTDLPLSGRIGQLMVIAAASTATPSCAGGKSSPNASLTVFWLPRRDARHGSAASSTTSVWRLVVGPRPALQDG
jgi:hypothetical protein